MKKIVALILAMVLVLGLVACGNDKNNETQPTETVSSTPVEYLDHRIAATAEELGSIITSESGPYEGYWDDALTFLVEEVDRQSWPLVLNLMNWGSNCLNTFSLFDSLTYESEYWHYAGGELTLHHLGEWHEIVATYNTQISKYYDSWLTVDRPLDYKTNSYLVMYAPNMGYYIIEISDRHPTQLSTLSEPYNDYYYVSGKWLDTQNESTNIVDSVDYAYARVLFNQHNPDAETTQEAWDESMTFLVENFPSQYWHEFFPKFAGPIAYAVDYDDINVINTNDLNSYGDPNSYGDEGNWSWSDGKFTNYGYNYIEWCYNMVLTKDTEGNTVATVDNPAEDGVMLVLLGDYYYYIVLFTDDAPTRLTNLNEHFVDEFGVIVHTE